MADAAQLREFSVDIALHQSGHSPLVRTLHDVNLTVPTGKLTALIGESGCGKSLVAATLCGLLPPGSRARGQIRIGGRDLSVAGERDWREVRGHHIGLVPQSAATSFTPVRTVGAQLTEVCRRLGADRSAAELLTAVHLPVDAGALYPHELSGGMAQRAAIAAAIAARPALLVADEPTSALDPAHAAAIWQLLGSIAEAGAGVLVITHDLRSLLDAAVCDDVALMRGGTIIRQAPLTEIADSADNYIGLFFAGANS
ncbi:ATP-binding cassette domain-containing protein [Mycolicibacterium goodii]|uniref:ATP-binding cassette domain-containing protein n=1 Tax=Mycolicibacterium goodii TaxID=134601 RepID=UPI001F04129A|nr:ATP-binding cassette domain-containing protein [Mycolicibacterium goodii]ULN49595.1 ATP-binding cassette domain-containing protein [Mycolicibacterium goodii]